MANICLAPEVLLSPEFQDMVRTTGIQRDLLAAKIATWQSQKETERFPTIAELGMIYPLNSLRDVYKRYNLINEKDNLKQMSSAAADKWIKSLEGARYSVTKRPTLEGRYIIGITGKKSMQSVLDYLEKEAKNNLKKPGTQTSLFGLDTSNIPLMEFHINTIDIINQFLEAAGVGIREVGDFLAEDGSVVKGAMAAANFIEGTVDIAADAEIRPEAWNKLPEEAAHFWYRLLKNNDELKQLLWDDPRTKERVEKLLGSNYSEAYGKDNINTMTEEAIGQLIAEAIKRIESKNGSPKDYNFLKKFIEWINSLIKRFQQINTQDHFEVAAMKILTHDMSDLMSWDEYNTLHNKVFFSDVITDQSSKPVDYTLISDIGMVHIDYDRDFDPEYQDMSELTKKVTYQFIGKDNRDEVIMTGAEPSAKKSSPIFNSQEEVDSWVMKEYGDLMIRRQRYLDNEVRDSQVFFDRLLNKSFKKKTKYLPKTLKKYYSITDSITSDKLNEWQVMEDLPQITRKLSSQEKAMIVQTNGYTNVGPTLKILPDLLKKYKNHPIVLSEVVKIDGAKKQDLEVLNGVKRLIQLENPDLKTISSEEFVQEVHNWLETNYLLGFVEETKNNTPFDAHGYRIDQTFQHVKGRVSDEDPDVNNLTEEDIRNMSYNERQRLAAVLGMTGNRNVFHRKISISFNDTAHTAYGQTNRHFTRSGVNPSAFGSLTDFYSKNTSVKDATLLHETQNDNIEALRNLSINSLSLDESFNQWEQMMNNTLLRNIQKIESGNKVVQYHNAKFNADFQKKFNLLSTHLFNRQFNTYQTDEQAYNQIKQLIQEQVDLYGNNSHLTPETNPQNPAYYQRAIDDQYNVKQRLYDLKGRGGIESLLDKEDIKYIKKIIEEANNITTNNTRINEFGEQEPVGLLRTKKQWFENGVQRINIKIREKLEEIYGKNNGLYFNLSIAAKPLPKSQRRPVRRTRNAGRRSEETFITGNASTELNTSIKYLFTYNENLINKDISQNISSYKSSWLDAKKGEVQNEFNTKLLKMTQEQYNQLYENFKHNLDMFNELLKLQAEKDISKIENVSSEDKTRDSLNKIENQKDTFQALKEKAEEKKAELEKKYQDISDDIKNIIDVELGYFVPLVHHLLQEQIKAKGKDFPLYFSGYQITQLTQGSSKTAAIYTGPDEISIVNKTDFTWNNNKYRTAEGVYKKTNPLEKFDYLKDNEVITEQEFNKAYQKATEQKAKEIKYQAAGRLGLLVSGESMENALKALKVYKTVGNKKEREQKENEIYNVIQQISGGKPIETGAIFNAMSSIPGIKLIWEPHIEGFRSNLSHGMLGDDNTTPGGYKVDLTNYNYTTPILYALKQSNEDTEVEDDEPVEGNQLDKLVEEIKFLLKQNLKTLQGQKLKNQKEKENKLKRIIANLETLYGVEAINIFIKDAADKTSLTVRQFNHWVEKDKSKMSRHEQIKELAHFADFINSYNILDDISKDKYFVEQYFSTPFNTVEEGVTTAREMLTKAVEDRINIKARFINLGLPMLASVLYDQKAPDTDKVTLQQLTKFRERIANIKANPELDVAVKNKKIKTLQNEINRLNLFPSDLKEFTNLLQTAAKDENMIDFLMGPLISSNDSVLALFAKLVKRTLEDARLSDIAFSKIADEIEEEYAKVTSNKDNFAEYNEGIYEIIPVSTGKDAEGNPTYTPRVAFVQKYDIKSFVENRNKFFEELGEKPEEGTPERKLYNKKKAIWYKENTQPKPEKTIKKILEDKENDYKEGVITKEEYADWTLSVIGERTYKGNTTITYMGELSEPAEKYTNPKWSAMYNEDGTTKNAKGKYHQFWLNTYLDSQEEIAESYRKGYILPSIPKGDIERAQSNGAKDVIKNMSQRSAFKQAYDTEYGSDAHTTPVFYTQYMHPDDVSLDLKSSVMQFRAMANRFKALNDIHGEITLAKALVDNRKTIDTDSKDQQKIDKWAEKMGYLIYKKKEGETNSQSHLNNFIEMVIHGEMHKLEEIFGMDAAKLTKTFTGFSAITTLALDILKGVANNIQGNIQLAIEANSKEFFSLSNLKNGKLYYAKSIPAFLSEFGRISSHTLPGQLVDLYDAIQGSFRDHYGRNISGSMARKLFRTNTLFFNQNFGEHEIQATTLFALLDAEKVMTNDGKEISLLQAYKQFGIDGVEKNTDFNEEKRFNLMNRLHALNKRLQGVYNEFDAGILQKYSLGRLVVLYRKHLVPGYKRRFKRYSVDYELGSGTEGFYRTFWNTFAKDLINYKLNMFKAWATYTPFEKAQIRRAITEMTIILSLVLVAKILKDIGGDDDDPEALKKKYMYNFLLYEAIRMRSETSQYVSPLDAYRVIKSPSAMTGTMERGIKFVDQFVLTWDPEKLDYKRKTSIWEKGDNKSWAYFLKLFGYSGYNISPSAAIQSFNSTYAR